MRLGVYPRERLTIGGLTALLIVAVGLLLAVISLLETINPGAHPYPF